MVVGLQGAQGGAIAHDGAGGECCVCGDSDCDWMEKAPTWAWRETNDVTVPRTWCEGIYCVVKCHELAEVGVGRVVDVEIDGETQMVFATRYRDPEDKHEPAVWYYCSECYARRDGMEKAEEELDEAFHMRFPDQPGCHGLSWDECRCPIHSQPGTLDDIARGKESVDDVITRWVLEEVEWALDEGDLVKALEFLNHPGMSEVSGVRFDSLSRMANDALDSPLVALGFPLVPPGEGPPFPSLLSPPYNY